MTEIGLIALPALLLLLAAMLFFYRRMIATAQSNFLGGRISPGCIVAEAILLLTLAAIFLIAFQSGMFQD